MIRVDYESIVVLRRHVGTVCAPVDELGHDRVEVQAVPSRRDSAAPRNLPRREGPSRWDPHAAQCPRSELVAAACNGCRM